MRGPFAILEEMPKPTLFPDGTLVKVDLGCWTGIGTVTGLREKEGWMEVQLHTGQKAEEKAYFSTTATKVAPIEVIFGEEVVSL